MCQIDILAGKISAAVQPCPAIPPQDASLNLDTGAELQEETQLPEVPVYEAVSKEPLSFESVAVGGTFDRLHVGHRLLLAATALVSTKHVYIGVTGV